MYKRLWFLIRKNDQNKTAVAICFFFHLDMLLAFHFFVVFGTVSPSSWPRVHTSLAFWFSLFLLFQNCCRFFRTRKIDGKTRQKIPSLVRNAIGFILRACDGDQQWCLTWFLIFFYPSKSTYFSFLNDNDAATSAHFGLAIIFQTASFFSIFSIWSKKAQNFKNQCKKWSCSKSPTNIIFKKNQRHEVTTYAYRIQPTFC